MDAVLEPSLSFSLRPAAQERPNISVFDETVAVGRAAAKMVADLICRRNEEGRKTVLGLPTGSTPVGMYRELARMHREEGLDLSRVVTFNLDEYFPMNPEAHQSYHKFMHVNFFNHVNIPAENIHILSGSVSLDQAELHCRQYEKMIEEAGGLDLTILGIGRNGHIAFNEPGTSTRSRTRMIVLDSKTRSDAASDFFGLENVPERALTMGIGTILESKQIFLLATGENKAGIVRTMMEGPITSHVPASVLREHESVSYFFDWAAAALLEICIKPWKGQISFQWNDYYARKAVLQLSQAMKLPISHLRLEHYHKEHLHDLVAEYGGVGKLFRLTADHLMKLIHTPEQLPGPGDRVLIFSPHPDDDVICMGGSMKKMLDNGADIHVAYQTNGSVSVPNKDVVRGLRYMEKAALALGLDAGTCETIRTKIDSLLRSEESVKPSDPDSPAMQKLKGLVRETEALNAIEELGLKASNGHFLDLPFYRTGTIEKKPIGEEDVQGVLDLLEELQPSYIFLAGDLTDPHGTHRQCYHAVRLAYDRYLDEGPSDRKSRVFLYRGAWQEWDMEDVDMIVPLAPSELDLKIQSIFEHESQKDKAMYPGSDEREFWQRARDRNCKSAELFCNLGLPSYYALELFLEVNRIPDGRIKK